MTPENCYQIVQEKNSTINEKERKCDKRSRTGNTRQRGI